MNDSYFPVSLVLLLILEINLNHVICWCLKLNQCIYDANIALHVIMNHIGILQMIKGTLKGQIILLKKVLRWFKILMKQLVW